MENKDLPILHSQDHGCWWPGDARSQGINNRDIDLLKPGQFGLRTLRVKTRKCKKNGWHSQTFSNAFLFFFFNLNFVKVCFKESNRELLRALKFRWAACTSENIACKMSAILFRPQYDEIIKYSDYHMAADGMVTQEARASVAMMWHSFQEFPSSAP